MNVENSRWGVQAREFLAEQRPDAECPCVHCHNIPAPGQTVCIVCRVGGCALPVETSHTAPKGAVKRYRGGKRLARHDARGGERA